jgi:hypothetical protein
MGLEAGAAEQPSEYSADLVMPTRHDLEQPCALRGKGPWEVTELARKIIDWLANVDEQNSLPLPFVLEQIDDQSKFSVITLKKGESASLDDLCKKFPIDPSEPYAACPDLFGDVSERVGIWSLAVAVIRSVTTMSEDQLRRFWSTPEINLPDSQGNYSASEQGKFYFDSLSHGDQARLSGHLVKTS